MLIQLKEIKKVYRTREIETTALDNVNIGIEKGEFVSVMGPSGCGKSTLLNIIGLLDQPTAGSVEIDGQPTAGLSDKAMASLRNSKLGFVFQSFHLIPTLNVTDNVELPLLYRKGVGTSERRCLVEEVLDKVGLSHRMRHMPAQLSGGQSQRVAWISGSRTARGVRRIRRRLPERSMIHCRVPTRWPCTHGSTNMMWPCAGRLRSM